MTLIFPSIWFPLGGSQRDGGGFCFGCVGAACASRERHREGAGNEELIRVVDEMAERKRERDVTRMSDGVCARRGGR